MKLGTIYLGAGQLKEAGDEAGFVLGKSPEDVQAPVLLAEAATTNQIAEIRLRLEKMSPAGGTGPLEVALGVLSFRQGDLKSAEAGLQTSRDTGSQILAKPIPRWVNYTWPERPETSGTAFKRRRNWLRPGRERHCNTPSSKSDGRSRRGETVVGRPCQKDAGLFAGLDYPGPTRRRREKACRRGHPARQRVSRDPQNLEGMMLKGRLELQQGQTAQATADFESHDPDVPQIAGGLYQLAHGPSANNETDKAVASLNQALTLKPNYGDAIQALAEIQIRSGNPAPAIVSLQQLARQLPPPLVPARLLLAEAYRIQGNLDSAVPIYRDLLRKPTQKSAVSSAAGHHAAPAEKPAGARRDLSRRSNWRPIICRRWNKR